MAVGSLSPSTPVTASPRPPRLNRRISQSRTVSRRGWGLLRPLPRRQGRACLGWLRSVKRADAREAMSFSSIATSLQWAQMANAGAERPRFPRLSKAPRHHLSVRLGSPASRMSWGECFRGLVVVWGV